MRSYVHTFLLALIFNIILWFHPLLLVLSPFTLVNSTRSFLHLNAGLNFKVESTLSPLRMHGRGSRGFPGHPAVTGGSLNNDGRDRGSSDSSNKPKGYLEVMK
jgi:hypothetical protein